MQNINIEKTSGAIKSINQRAEKHGDEKKIAIDVDILTEVPANYLQQLSIGDDSIDYEKLFFDDNKNIKTLGMKSISFDREFKDHTAVVGLDDLQENTVTLIDIKVKKFSASFVYGNRIALSFQFQAMPDDEQLVFLAHAMTRKNITIEIIESKQTELFEESEENKENETAEA